MDLTLHSQVNFGTVCKHTIRSHKYSGTHRSDIRNIDRQMQDQTQKVGGEGVC